MQVHRVVQMSAVCCMLVGAALVLAVVETHAQTTHHGLGLALVALALSQPILAVCRGAPTGKFHRAGPKPAS